MKNKLMTAAVATLLVNLICLVLAGSTGDHYWFYAMFAIVATGLITFFGILLQNIEEETHKIVSSRSMRLAITGLVTSAYVVLLVYVLFIPEKTILSDVAKTLLTNFTAVVGTVVAFFFGSAAYIERQNIDQETGK